MRTSNEMIEYCDEKGFGKHVNKQWKELHFGRIANVLEEGEEVAVAFTGLHNYKKLTRHENMCSYVYTNKRLLIMQLFQDGERFQFINIKDIKSITLEKGRILSAINITKTDDNILKIGQRRSIASKIFDSLKI